MPYVSSSTPFQAAQKPEPEPASKAITPQQEKRRFFWQGKIGPAFWTISSIISMIVNIILVVVLISMGRQLFMLKSLVQNQLLGGLYENFVLMDQAHIRTTIPVSTSVPAKFNLPLKTNTVVTLTEDTHLSNATIYEFNAGNMLYIPRANTNIILKAGTQLPVALDLTVPVNQKIPVKLNVKVDIPLNKTELHEPFVGLQEVVKPYYTLIEEMPGSWQEALCGPKPSGLCQTLVH